MTPAGFTISMSLTVEPTPQGTGARAPIIWERGGDPTPSPRGRAQTVDPEPQGTEGVFPLIQIAGHVGQRVANRKLTKCTARHESACQND